MEEILQELIALQQMGRRFKRSKMGAEMNEFDIRLRNVLQQMGNDDRLKGIHYTIHNYYRYFKVNSVNLEYYLPMLHSAEKSIIRKIALLKDMGKCTT